ncbi:hypothetical protein K9M48_02175 [Candidatus Gracilibacteria bacterium]|nr:hypothetical protein [Candidatus Gracilibacteria bacterium]
MYHIRYEYLSDNYPRFRVYKIYNEEEIQNYTLHLSFFDAVKKSQEYPRYDHIFMLDESRFSFFRFDVYQKFDKKITIQDLQKIIDEKVSQIKQQREISDDIISTYIDTIYVDGDSKKFLIGEKGEVFFRLYIIYINKVSLNTINRIYGNVLSNKHVAILPQSFYTALFLRNILKKENFVLLYINENYCKTIKINQGFYQKVNFLNLGMGSLRQMYKDNGISHYRYKDYETIEKNSLAKSLVTDTIQFYAQNFCKWMKENDLVGSDIIVISPIVKNSHFIEILNNEYGKYNNNYIVPFHHSDSLSDFGKNRDPEDMDFLVLINQKKNQIFGSKPTQTK